jgi:hypothetical protein
VVVTAAPCPARRQRELQAPEISAVVSRIQLFAQFNREQGGNEFVQGETGFLRLTEGGSLARHDAGS